MKTCEICGKEHDGSYGSGRFCSSECAHKSSVKHTDLKDTHIRVSKTLKKRSDNEIYQASLEAILTYNRNHPDKPKELPSLSHLVKNSEGTVIRRSEKKKCRICGEIECPDYKACSHMKHLKLEKFKDIMDLSKLGSIDIYIEYAKLQRYIYDIYINQKLSSPDIAKKLNINWVSVMFLLRKFNIPKRNKSESTMYAYINHPESKMFQGGWSMYHCGYHTSWEGKRFWYRSSYELDYAKILDKNHISYEVESIRLLYKSSIYKRNKVLISDFYLPDTNTIVEVKSDFTYLEQDYRDRLSVLVPMGYNCKLLLEHQWYGIDNIPKQKDGKTISDLD